jgi:hypothetical protein
MVAPAELEPLLPKASKLAVESSSNDTPSGVPLSDTMTTVSRNYTTYNVTAETLRLLQDWIRQQQEIYK